jgi:hypothetical protein
MMIEHVESYASGLESGSFDKDISDDDRQEVASILRNAVQTAIDFGHVSDTGEVSRWKLYALCDRDDVSGHITFAPNLGRAKTIIENI